MDSYSLRERLVIKDGSSKTFKISRIGLKGFISKLLVREKKTARYGFISITSVQTLVNAKDRMMDLSCLMDDRVNSQPYSCSPAFEVSFSSGRRITRPKCLARRYQHRIFLHSMKL